MPACFFVTVDDCGVCAGIDDAAIDLAQKGFLRRVAAFVNFERPEALKALSKVGLRVGIHLSISSGPPISRPNTIPSLLKDGVFKAPTLAVGETIETCLLRYYQKVRVLPVNEIVSEFQAQFLRYEEILGCKPAFVTVHHGLDRCTNVNQALRLVEPEQMGRQELLYRRKLRRVEPLFLSDSDNYRSARASITARILSLVPSDSALDNPKTELVIHPSTCSSSLELFTYYRFQRELEYKVWSSGVIHRVLRGRPVSLE